MTTAADVLQVARRQIGTKENPPGTNSNKYGKWYGMDRQPWCAMFVSYCFDNAGLTFKFPKDLGTSKGFAYCPYGVKWFKNQGLWHTENPLPGDVVFYMFNKAKGVSDHVGIVEKVLSNGQIQAIEGNTSTSSNDNGGTVMRRTRTKNQILGYGRPNYNDTPNPTAAVGDVPSWDGKYISLTSPAMESESIRLWQKCMKERGYDIEVDGEYGLNSERICREFQGKMNLDDDGVIGRDTWNASWRQPKKSGGDLSVDKPVDRVRYPLHHPVQFSGSAQNGVVKIKLCTTWGGAEFPLGEKVPVVNGQWRSSYQFQTGGDRKIVIEGLDSNDQVIDSISTDVIITLDPDGNNDVDSVRITKPKMNEELDLGLPVKFEGVAEDPKIKKIKLRTPFGDKNFYLSNKDNPIIVQNGRWQHEYLFSTGGTRKIVAEGIDASGNLIDSAAIEITIKSKESSSVSGSNAPNLRRVIGIEKTTISFRNKVVQISKELGVDPNYLMAAMSFETGGTFSPAIRSFSGSGATGLIQFMGPTARSLGTTTTALAKMSPEEQLNYVKKYFWRYRNRLKTLEDVYMAILYPAAIGKGPNHVLFRQGTISYQQNKGLDGPPVKGFVTVGDATKKVSQRFV
jgi:hypothetical protein